MASIIKVDTIQTAAGGTPTAADLGLNTTGSVLQVQTGTTSTVTSSSSTTFVPSAMAVSITPKFASSKILITINGSVYHFTNAQSAVALYRDGTNITHPTNGLEITWLESTRGVFSSSGQVIDTPNTTSTVEYKVYFRKRSGDYSVDYPTGAENMTVIITAMEIAG